jgi:hypothetical protein
MELQENDEIDIDEYESDEDKTPLYYVAIKPQNFEDNGGKLFSTKYYKLDQRTISSSSYITEHSEITWFKNNYVYPVYKNEDFNTKAEYIFVEPTDLDLRLPRPKHVSGLYFIGMDGKLWYNIVGTNTYISEQFLEKIFE